MTRLLIAVVAALAGAAPQTAPYTRAATQSCLARLPNAVVGLPPATPPATPALFVSRLAPDGPRRPHTQLGVWTGRTAYRGIVLSFFKSTADARASATSIIRDGGVRVGNVVASWDGRPKPSRSVRAAVLGCLRAGVGGNAVARPAPPATLATFAGGWGGHTRSLSIGSGGRGRERADDGCCTRVYDLTFQILAVHGTITHATATYRVTSYTRREPEVPLLHIGDVRELVLRNGIVTDKGTGVYYCSDPAWGATGACGA